jgi:hypothetical protein
MRQVAIPVELSPTEVARESSLGGAIELCVKAAGMEPKQVQSELKFDKGQFSRWLAGSEGVIWSRLQLLMDHCGNDAPVLWQLYQRGYDLHALRRRETELEKRLRLSEEENAALRRVLMGGRAT